MPASCMNPELLFVAACCRWPDDETRRRRVARLADQVRSWEQVVALTATHRVEGLVHHAVRSAPFDLPQAVAGRLATMAGAVRRKALQSLGEALRITGLLDTNAVEFRVIKGLPVAALAYGSVTIKNSVDLDLLVRRRDAVRAARILHEAGYSQVRPWRRLGEREFHSWSKVAKEACFVGDRGQVDLHWDLLDQPAVLTGLDPWEEPRLVPLVGQAGVPTLPDPAHLAYLAGHGGMSGWSRLKWVADFAAFINARPEQERTALCSAARAMAGRTLDQGLILAGHLLGPGYPEAAEPGECAGQLAAAAEKIIAARTPGVVIESQRDAMKLLSRSQWRLRAGLRYKAHEIERRFREQEIRFRLRLWLPGPLAWLFWPLRLPGAAMGFVAQRLRGEVLDRGA